MSFKLFSAAGLFVILSLEKVLQHLITGFLFVVEVEGIGTPSIGESIQLSGAVMAGLNLAFALLFGAGIFLFLKGNHFGKQIILVMALADILLEFVFHGLGFITLSVIVSSVLLWLGLYQEKRVTSR